MSLSLSFHHKLSEYVWLQGSVKPESRNNGHLRSDDGHTHTQRLQIHLQTRPIRQDGPSEKKTGNTSEREYLCFNTVRNAIQPLTINTSTTDQRGQEKEYLKQISVCLRRFSSVMMMERCKKSIRFRQVGAKHKRLLQSSCSRFRVDCLIISLAVSAIV